MNSGRLCWRPPIDLVVSVRPLNARIESLEPFIGDAACRITGRQGGYRLALFARLAMFAPAEPEARAGTGLWRRGLLLYGATCTKL